MSQLSIEQALQKALQHHQAGQLPQAEALYRQVLARQANQPDALHLLGVIARQVGQTRAAVDLIRQAIAQRPDFPAAYTNLGNALKDAGKPDEAIAAFRQAIALNPGFADAYNNLGNGLMAKGQLDEAIASYQQALALRPAYPEALTNLGSATREKGRVEEAVALHRRAIALRPQYAEAHCNLGNALKDMGRLDEAIAAYQQAIALRANYADAHSNLANALLNSARVEDAIAAYRRAIAIKPDSPEILSNLGNALREIGQTEEAIAVHQRAIFLNPTLGEAHSNLSNALREDGQIDQAIAAAQQAIALKPGFAEAFGNLGFALTLNGQIEEALAAYRRAIELNPGNADAQSNYLMTLHYHPDFDAGAIAREHARWEEQHARPLTKWIVPHTNDRDPDRRLRIGYVSPDFHNHPVGRFLEPLLANHDRQSFEIFAYSQGSVADAITRRLRSGIDGWRDIAALSDSRLADLIRWDRIDILVDLTLHAARNRLLTFARKPAPIQVTWLAYPGSTGLKTVDYRLSDPYLDPVGIAESIYSERTFRLPDSYWCYLPHNTASDVGALPVLAKGRITFGCLNNFFKVSEPTLNAWVRILQAVPSSQLLLHAPRGSSRQRLQAQFQNAGIDPQRLQFTFRVPLSDYFRLYDQIDIALDTFPFAGGTTTCDALWMGAPVVSLLGKTAMGRGGFSILSNIGLPELVASSVEDYIQLATTLSQDVPRLTELRANLRQKMQQSPLTDAPRFAHGIEAAYRQMWQRWCASPDQAVARAE